jgi:beta-aspartyl-peptidase (threonine type)
VSPIPETGSRTRILLSLIALGILLLVAIRLRQTSRPSDEQVREAVRNVLGDQQEAWNMRDLRGFMDGYWQDEQLTFYSGGEKTFGWQATLERYRRKYQGEGQEMGHLTFSEIEIDVLGGETALVRGRWELAFKEKDKAGGLFTLLFRKMPQGWCIVHDHTTM